MMKSFRQLILALALSVVAVPALACTKAQFVAPVTGLFVQNFPNNTIGLINEPTLRNTLATLTNCTATLDDLNTFSNTQTFSVNPIFSALPLNSIMTGGGNIASSPLQGAPNTSVYWDGSGNIHAGALPNSSIANPAITVNGVVISLGGTGTIAASATSVTPGTTTVTGGTNNGVMSQSGGVLQSSTTLPSGLTVPSPTITGTLGGSAVIPNAALANSSLTVNGVNIGLGASGTVTAAVSAGSVIPSNVTATTQANSDTTTLVSTDAFGQNILTLATGNVAGADGSGSNPSTNNTIIQNALTALSGNGQIHLPCGVFKITVGMTVTVAANSHVDISGSGNDCTTLFASGAINPLTITYTGLYASASVHDLTITTDQTNAQTGLVLSQSTSNGNPAISAQTRIENVYFRGTGGITTTTNYFAKDIDIENVSNVSINNVFCYGVTASSSTGGRCIYLNGLPGSSTYGGAYNVSNVRCYANQDCLYINDYIQGVTINAMNSVHSWRGVEMNGSAVGNIDQIAIVNSQFGSDSDRAVSLTGAAANLKHVKLVNNYFINAVAGGDGVFIAGQWNTVVGNSWLGVVGQSITYMTAAGLDMTVIGNNFYGSLAGGGTDTAIAANGTRVTVSGNTISEFQTGISVASGAAFQTFSDNEFQNNTTDYSINASAGVANVIKDTIPRLIANLPACISGLNGSEFIVANANAPTYAAAFSGTGSVTAKALCNGATTAWQAH